MTILIRKTSTSAHVMTDEPAAALELIERHAAALRVNVKALGLARRTESFGMAAMSAGDLAQIEAAFGSIPAEVVQIELIRAPGGTWIADAMLAAGEALSA